MNGFRTRISWLVFILAVLVLLVVSTSPPGFDPGVRRDREDRGMVEPSGAPSTDEKEEATLLDPALASLVQTAEEKSEADVRALALATGLDYEAGRVTVVVESMPGEEASARAALAEAGGTETGSYEHLIRAAVPVRSLEWLSRHEAVFKVRAPMRPVPGE